MTRTLAALLLLSAWISPTASAERWAVDPDEDLSEVRFRSEATLEDFEGVGRELSGWIELNSDDTTTLTGEFEFQLESLDTGLGLRNKHMRDNVLHTEDHPTARFLIERCSAGAVTSEPATFGLEGTFSIHGVSKPMTAEATAYREGDALVCRAEFEIRLEDFDMERPKMLVLKVAETVSVTLKTQLNPADSKASP